MTAFFLAASVAEELSGSVTDPALLPSSSSRNARLRVDEELTRILTKAVNVHGLEWSPLRSHLAAVWKSVFSRGAVKPPANARPPFFPEIHTSSRYRGTPPTHLVSVLLLQLLSHLLTALKKKDTSTCLLWMNLWPHISARPHLSDGRRGIAIRPSRPEPHLHSLDEPTWRLDKRLQRCTLWLCSRSSLPGQDTRQWGSRSGSSFSQGRDRPGSTHHQSHRPGSIRAPALAHDDGDERGWQSSLPRRSGFVR